MRLVIPYKLSENSEELRFAIRSMVKHFKPFSGVLLIGDKPEWFCGDHIPMADTLWPDQPNRIWKERSMQLKVLAAPDEVFLYSNDDYFALQDFKVTPYYWDVECWEMARDHTIGSYRDMYEQCQPHWKNFDVHTPMIIDRDKFKARFDEMLAMDCQWPIKTMYAKGFEGPRITDVKIRGAHTKPELEYITKGRPYYSTHNSAINPELTQFWTNLYPDKSDYERD